MLPPTEAEVEVVQVVTAAVVLVQGQLSHHLVDTVAEVKVDKRSKLLSRQSIVSSTTTFPHLEALTQQPLKLGKSALKVFEKGFT